MTEAWVAILLCGLYPLVRLCRSCRESTLRHPAGWAVAAWLGGVLAAAFDPAPTLLYLALCLTACAGVAVLGARRPGAAAWHLVVAGLLATLLLPVWQGLGELRLQPEHLVFLAVTLVVGIGNYLPTRQAPAAILLLAFCGAELMRLADLLPPDRLPLWPVLAAVPWLALALARPPQASLDGIWRTFRDSYGFLWAQRCRDQFNRAAENAGLPARLGWSGLDRPLDPADAARAMALLEAVLQRFREE
ncbi:MAG: hypothetical protein U0736_09390 [Gemmataceae bacterium]